MRLVGVGAACLLIGERWSESQLRSEKDEVMEVLAMMSSYAALDLMEVRDWSSALSFLWPIVISLSWLRRRASNNNAPAAASVQPAKENNQQAAEDPEREALRAQHQVRPLTEEEDGYALHSLPDGVYGFTGAVATRDAPLFRKSILHSFEVHKRPDGTVLLVGCVSPADASKLDGTRQSATIKLFAERQDGASTLVSLPLHQILRHKEHSQRIGGGVQLEIEPED